MILLQQQSGIDSRTLKWIAVIVLGVVLFGSTAPAAAGQELYDGGIAAAAKLGRIYILADVDDDNDHCRFSSAVLEAEAERAFRRDGVTALPLPQYNSEGGGGAGAGAALLKISVTSLPTGRARWCAIFVSVQLTIHIGAAVLLAADGGTLLHWRAPEHVSEIRRVVEERVSVIANAIRRVQR